MLIKGKERIVKRVYEYVLVYGKTSYTVVIKMGGGEVYSIKVVKGIFYVNKNTYYCSKSSRLKD